MKKLSILSLFLLTAITFSSAQVYDTLGGRIRMRSDSGNTVEIYEDKNIARGFTIALGGYEVAFTGIGETHPFSSEEKHKRARCKNYDGRLSAVDIGFNFLTSPGYAGYGFRDGDLDLRNGKSVYLSINAFQTSTALDRKGNFGFTTGLSVVWRNYVFSNALTLQKDGGKLVPEYLPTTNFKKSKLTTFALEVPVIFEYNFHKFFVSGGGYAGLVLASHTKYKSPKTKSGGGNYIEMFQYGLTARAGYRHLYLFGNYGLNSLFRSHRAPKTRTYTVGFGFPF